LRLNAIFASVIGVGNPGLMTGVAAEGGNFVGQQDRVLHLGSHFLLKQLPRLMSRQSFEKGRLHKASESSSDFFVQVGIQTFNQFLFVHGSLNLLF
jgi:hypothetical protein